MSGAVDTPRVLFGYSFYHWNFALSFGRKMHQRHFDKEFTRIGFCDYVADRIPPCTFMMK